MRWALPPIALATAAIAASLLLAGCSSRMSCTTGSCAAQEIQRTLIGDQAKDGAAITKAVCKDAVLDPGGTWTASCTVTESDGAIIQGDGNWSTSDNEVTYEVTAVPSS
jgi:hypothetical protein